MNAEQTQLTPRQQVYLRAYAKSYGSITKACKKSGIPRRTVYNWLQTSQEFANESSRVMEEIKDFVEEKLLEQIGSGNFRATKFFLEHKAKDRGYGT